MANVEEIITDRGSSHGLFEENGGMTWEIMNTLMRHRRWATLPGALRHGIYMIVHKIARIVAGDPLFDDHWLDIGGYSECCRRHAAELSQTRPKMDEMALGPGTPDDGGHHDPHQRGNL